MSTKMRVWNKSELTIAYYIAKFGLNGLKMSEEHLAYNVIGNTTVRSLQMQSENFRYLLGFDSQLSHTSKAQRDLADKLQNKTTTQVREIIFDYCDIMEDVISKKVRAAANKKTHSKKDELNAQLQLNFEAQVANMKAMGRNLTPINKK